MLLPPHKGFPAETCAKCACGRIAVPSQKIKALRVSNKPIAHCELANWFWSLIQAQSWEQSSRPETGHWHGVFFEGSK